MNAKTKNRLIIDINNLIRANLANEKVVKFYQKELQKVIDIPICK